MKKKAEAKATKAVKAKAAPKKAPAKKATKAVKTVTKKAVTVDNLTKGIHVPVEKRKKPVQIINRGVPEKRNTKTEEFIKKNQPVSKAEVIAFQLKHWPETSKKMAMRTITRGKSEKYNKKFTKFERLIVEEVKGYIGFTKACFKGFKAPEPETSK